MNIEKLTIRRPAGPQPHWCVAHLVYDGGPIAAVLWWDDEPSGGREIDEHGVMGEEKTAADDDPTGWSFWLLGDESPSPEDPRRGAANVTCIGPTGSPDDALSALAQALEDAEEPTWDYSESIAMVETALWRSPGAV